MSIKKIATLVLLLFLLCTFLFPDVQGWWAVRRRRSSSRPRHNHSWQKGRTKNTKYIGWHTSFESAFSRPCKKARQSIWSIQSVHEYYHEDRVWGFFCKYDYKIKTGDQWCTWLKTPGYSTSFDGSFDRKCPRNGHITGMAASAFNGYFKDREFNFKCCDGTVPRKGCFWTSYRNGWDKKLDYDVPSQYYLAGVSSYHDNYYEDRRWRFYICR